ncbi:MAG: pre-peptidase C-terminal domain-containing protein, partial [Algicola sp.]|nr:pre-peptidase C-terminal domain-containing protein [Algicola sp.]
MKILKLSLPCAIAIATLSVSANAADIVLNKGEIVTMSGVQDSQTFYTFNTPANVDSVSFYMDGGTGDADLIVKFGSKPTQSTYDCRSLPSGNDEHCLFEWGQAQTGTYYVMIR